MGTVGGGRAWDPGATPRPIPRSSTPLWRWRSSGSPWTAARSRHEWWTTMVRRGEEGTRCQCVPTAATDPSGI